MCLYTFVVYVSSSIYVSSELLIMERFGVGEFKASLGLALYVLGEYLHASKGSVTADGLMLGYGIGPLLFAPLSEGK